MPFRFISPEDLILPFNASITISTVVEKWASSYRNIKSWPEFLAGPKAFYL